MLPTSIPKHGLQEGLDAGEEEIGLGDGFQPADGSKIVLFGEHDTAPPDRLRRGLFYAFQINPACPGRGCFSSCKQQLSKKLVFPGYLGSTLWFR